MSDTGIVKIKGKDYKTVALRVQEFREQHDLADWGIMTEIIGQTETHVTMKASVIFYDEASRACVVATGHAEEDRGASKLNRTSALENAETSAIGRALAFAGYGGTHIASAEEVQQALLAQEAKASEKSTQHRVRLEGLLEAALNAQGDDGLSVQWSGVKREMNQLGAQLSDADRVAISDYHKKLKGTK